ncbi:EAL domain-containing protein [Sulfurimonas sp. SAG-AH-194-C20]|nr:EAL domain-containing protein [Sulfurimonas sp. SAG-AH-194-C20]MDF1878945.1 EAL domain-containing protein [Sulfurimonas sp. SAG-AH-194-C20]
MNITKKMLEEEIKVLQAAAQLHANKSIDQYREVLKVLEELEAEKHLLEEKVKERTLHLERLAKYDTLTNLPNRHMFKEELELTLKSATLLDKPFALIFLDIDGFKEINDTYGHHIGDILLKELSNKLLLCVREGTDTVSRLGGDEFTIILRGLNKVKHIDIISNKILKYLHTALDLTSDIQVKVSASLGVYIHEHDNNITVDEIISNADIAMYEAKKSGKNQYVYFDKKMKSLLSKHITLKQELTDAFKAKEFVNYVQPIVSAQTHEILGVEILLRWKKNTKLMSPAYFIETLENMDLILDVTFWQIEAVLLSVKELNKEIFFSFNLTAKMLNNSKIIDFLIRIKQHCLVKPSNIYLELTENDFAKDIQKTKTILQAISSLGFKISLDDFGTGYSSLSYIRNFPIDVLKIDQTFVKGIEKSTKDYKLFQSIMSMGEILKMDIVVEGVETKEQLKLIDNKSFVKIQGYYFYKPMPIQEFISIINLID